ncbi:MAG TPA: protein kinase [Polyangiales bacterium]|nr:protein kinase [Polyangiales bacterium]
MSDPQTLDLLNQVVLGRYRVLRQLAHGGMGAVYLGRTEGAEGFARPVVVKRILPWLTEDKGVAEMFVREARILSNMQHPNIVSVLDFGQKGDGSYLMVLDYVHGYDLSEWQDYEISERGNIPVDYALHIICKVLDALHYAHTLKRADGKPLGIVHRDVTPTNVFLSDQGVVKLLDFGIALVVDEERKFTGRNEVRGKLPYLPAEVVNGAAPTVASDVYSAGVTLYELLTGTNPFDGKQPTEIFVKILTSNVAPVSSWRPDIPAGLDDVIARALDRDLDRRYKTAAELARALRALSSRSEGVIASELTEQLQQDFADMPAKLGIGSLTQREEAWRSTSQRTEALPSVSIAAPSGKRELPAPDPSSKPRGSSGSSTSRMLLVAAVAGIAAAGAVLIGWLVLEREPVQERMVVIAKESALPQQALGRLPAAEPEAPTPSESPVAPATPATPASAPLQPTAAKTAARPATPDANELSRTFMRRQKLVQACFAKHASAQEQAVPLTLHFQVAATGLVENARIQPDALSQQPLGRCLIGVAKGTRFGALAKRVSFHIPITTEKIARQGP